MSRLLSKTGGRLIGYHFNFGEYDFLPPVKLRARPRGCRPDRGGDSDGITDLRTILAMSSAKAKGPFAAAGDLARTFRSPRGTWWASCNAGDQARARVAERAGNHSGRYVSADGLASKV